VISTANNTVMSSITVGDSPYAMAYDNATGLLYVCNQNQGTVSIVSPGSSSIVFVESGLPAGSSWGVSLNGTVSNSTTATIAFAQPYGPYPFTVGVEAGYAVRPASGLINLIGPAVAVDVSFAPSNTTPPPTTYLVSLLESGLSAGTDWTVSLGGVISSASGDSINFEERNGTYSLRVNPIPEYLANFTSSIVVAGAPVQLNVTFSSFGYPAAITESGLPAHAVWSMSATNTATHQVILGQSSTATIAVTLSNGSYTLVAFGPVGYAASVSPSHVTINGGSPTLISVDFTPTSPGAVPPNSVVWLITGVLVITAVLGIVGAGWGYARYRVNRLKTEAAGWFQEFHDDATGSTTEFPREH